MHQFICKSIGGNITPQSINKRKLYRKLLDDYEARGMSFKITIEILSKNINESQVSLYNAFILRASEHFGNSFIEMSQALERLHPLRSFVPKDYKSLEKWNAVELDDFINKANALLLEADSDFKF